MDNEVSCTSSEANSVSNLRFIVTTRAYGQAVQAPELFYRAWDECIELHVMDKYEWVGTTLSTLACIKDRYEIGMHNGDVTVGGIILAPDLDIHVGQCLSVFAQYVMPEYRNRGISLRCMRLAEQIAKDMGFPVLAYTHRLGDWRYETIYKRIACPT